METKSLFPFHFKRFSAFSAKRSDEGHGKRRRLLYWLAGAILLLVALIWVIFAYVVPRHSPNNDDDEVCYYDYITDDICFCKTYNGNGYIINKEGNKTLNNVFCIAKPLEGDSLVFFSNGEKRGYFHLRDGRLALPPIYNHAWVYSEGLAAVEVNGKVKFINTKGKVVIDRGFCYDIQDDGYVFHNGHCAVNDSVGKHMGLIDRDGNWVLPPIYTNIYPYDTLWLLTVDDKQAILTFCLDTVMPLMVATYAITDTVIEATFDDHTQSLYDLQGKLLVDNQIRDVDQLMYSTREMMYSDSRVEDDDSYYYNNEPSARKAVATCLRYEAEMGWYGLMSPNGKLITPPSYYNIEAVDKDLYFCETRYGFGVMLNSKGQRVD